MSQSPVCGSVDNESQKRRSTHGRRPIFKDQKIARLNDYAEKGQFLIRFVDYDQNMDEKIWCVEDHILLRSWIRVPEMETEGKRVFTKGITYMGWWPDETTDYHLIGHEACRMIDEKHVEIEYPNAEHVKKLREERLLQEINKHCENEAANEFVDPEPIYESVH